MENNGYTKRGSKLYWLFLTPALIVLLLFKWLPVVSTLFLSFVDWDILTPPKFLGLANYKNIILDTLFWKYLRNSLFLSTFTVLVSVPLSVFVTILLVEIGKGRKLFRKLLIIPLVSSLIGFGIIWRWMYNPDFGLINYLLSLIGIDGPEWLCSTVWAKPAIVLMRSWHFLGLGMLVCLAGLKGISEKTYEKIKARGLSFWGRTSHVYLPHLRGCILLFSLFLFAHSFYTFSAQYIMTGGGPAGATTNLGYYIYNNAFQWFRMGYACTISTVVIALMLILATLAIKVVGKSDMGLIPAEKRETFPAKIDSLKTVSRSKLVMALVILVLAVIAVIHILPFIWSFVTSLKESGKIFTCPPQFIPRPLSLKNYTDTWKTLSFLRFFRNSLLISSAITVLTVPIFFLAAYSTVVIKGRFHRLFTLAILLTLFIPLELLAVPVFTGVWLSRLIDTFSGLILPNLAWPFGFLLFVLFLERFPENRLSQARQSGWSEWQVLRRVILPGAKPVLFLGTAVVFLSSWRSFTWPLLCTNSMEKKVLSIGLASFQGVYTTEWALLMTASCITIFPVIILFLLIEAPIFSSVSLPNFLPPVKDRKRFAKKTALWVSVIVLALAFVLHPARLRDAGYREGLMIMNWKSYQRAIDHFRQETKKSPDSRMILQIGRCYEELGESTRAIETYRELIGNYPDSALADKARERVMDIEQMK